MRLSCAEQMLGRRPIEDKLDVVREAGLDGIDLRMATIGEPSARDRVAGSGVPIGAIYSQLREPGLLSARAADRAVAVDRVVEYAETADAVGASNLILVPVFGEAKLRGFEPLASLHQVESAVLMASLAEIAERAAGLSVRVTIEPLNHGETHFLTDPGVGAAICTAIGSPRVATMVDTYHCEREGQDIPEMIRAAGDQLALVHLSDTDRRLPGDGDIDFRAVLAALDQHGYTGWLGLECRPVDDVENLRRTVRHLRGVWPTPRDEGAGR